MIIRPSTASYICSCPICQCKCNASFTRDKLQLLFQKSKFEAESTKKDTKKSSSSNSLNPEQISSHQSVLGGIAKICSDSSTNAIIRVLQNSGGFNNHNQPTSVGKTNCLQDSQAPIRNTVHRAMGVASLGLTQNVTIAGDQNLRNKIRSELGGAPSTMLNETSETVSHYYQRTGKDNSSSRAYRNNLKQSKKSQSEGLKSQIYEENKKRVSKRLLQRFRSTRDTLIKKKIKYCIKKLSYVSDDNCMINTVFDLCTNEGESFSSFDVADDLINFVDDNDLN